MRIKLSHFITVIFILISGQNMYSQDFEDLTQLLDKWTLVMKHYIGEMSECNDLEKLALSCNELADSVTFYYPKMNRMREKYPEFAESGPPEELREFFTNFGIIENKYNDMLNELAKIANANSENEVYQTAFGKLNMAIYNARR